MSDKAKQLIEHMLDRLMASGLRKIDNHVLYVTSASPLAEEGVIDTKYGPLPVVANNHLPKGAAYIMENPTGKPGRGFEWVAKNQESLPSEPVK